ncbi:uncharacterized protein LOC144155261 [Haemaphysalis longicornis]
MRGIFASQAHNLATSFWLANRPHMTADVDSAGPLAEPITQNRTAAGSRPTRLQTSPAASPTERPYCAPGATFGSRTARQPSVHNLATSSQLHKRPHMTPDAEDSAINSMAEPLTQRNWTASGSSLTRLHTIPAAIPTKQPVCAPDATFGSGTAYQNSMWQGLDSSPAVLTRRVIDER